MEQSTSAPDPTELTIEELMQVKIISVSKRPEPWFDAPAAVYVITGDEIRRSGYTSVAEVLRLAPGLQVARFDAATWAITVRGFNGLGANKLLVLVDGRSVYNQFYSGVVWDEQNLLLEDVDRIEIVRGPGGTLWGANAVNGVINIITKSARHTQGFLIEGGGGTEERAHGALRYGGKMGENAYFRTYALYFYRDDFVFADGRDGADEWQLGQGGFRIDWHATEDNLLTIQGDGYRGREGQTVEIPSQTAPDFVNGINDEINTWGGNVIGRWTHTFLDGSDMTFQSYYDHRVHDRELVPVEEQKFDLDFQHRFSLGNRQGIVWGAGYRLGHSEITPTEFQTMSEPQRRTTHLYSAFVQDEFVLVPDRLRLTLGTKLEHNSFTGWEAQPSGRLAWTPTGRQTVWCAVSRAVRTPARAEHDGTISVAVLPPGTLDPALPTVVQHVASPDFDSEELIAYEIGYRIQLLTTLLLDVAMFYNDYDRLLSTEFRGIRDEPGPPPHKVLEFQRTNRQFGEVYGADSAVRWQLNEWWRLNLAYSYLRLQLHRDSGAQDTSSERGFEGASPQHQFVAHTSMDLPHRVHFDLILRYVDNLPSLEVPNYVTLDARLAWRPNRNCEVAVVGQNLLDDRHPEFRAGGVVVNTEVERGVYGKVTWRY